jgi:hypothetical protein
MGAQNGLFSDQREGELKKKSLVQKSDVHPAAVAKKCLDFQTPVCYT